MNNKWLLIVAAVLVAIGIFKPSLENINIPLGPKPQVVVVDELNLPEPKTPELRVKANDVIQALSISADRKTDAKRLAGLYNDMATLISLTNENEVIKNTDEIRQANRLAGLMLKLDIKGKYPDLPKAAQSLVIEAIGDDHVLLNEELREKAVDGFKALAWACYEGSK
jgi:hypothetical protein